MTPFCILTLLVILGMKENYFFPSVSTLSELGGDANNNIISNSKENRLLITPNIQIRVILVLIISTEKEVCVVYNILSMMRGLKN